jgi:hypothetical protein
MNEDDQDGDSIYIKWKRVREENVVNQSKLQI